MGKAQKDNKTIEPECYYQRAGATAFEIATEKYWNVGLFNTSSWMPEAAYYIKPDIYSRSLHILQESKLIHYGSYELWIDPYIFIAGFSS